MQTPFGAIPRNADSTFVEASCERCLPAEKRPFHRRVAHLGLCRRCIEKLGARRQALAPTRPLNAERWSLALAYSGLIVRTGVYVLLFWWASRGEAGAAALQGAVAADILTFLILGAIRMAFDGVSVTVDAAFEFMLIVLYLSRHMLFDIRDNASHAGVALIFFLAFASVRLGVWGAGQAEDSVSGT